jgi:DNA-binding NarL/FixJ family response regulator
VGRRPVRVRLFLIAAVRFYEEGLRDVLRRDERFDVVGTAPDVRRALVAMQGAPPPDIALLDVTAPGGCEGALLLRATRPEVRVVALGLHEDPDGVIDWARAGAAGFVGVDASLEELATTLVGVARGEAPCSPRVSAALLRDVSARAGAGRRGPRRAAAATLTAREREIAWLLNDGLSNKEIAGRLHIELGTVKNHVHNLLGKLGVAGRGQAAAALRDDAGVDRRVQAGPPGI